MSKAAGINVAARAIALANGPEIPYSKMKCDALVEQCINDSGGGMGNTRGSNTIARKHCAWLGTIENAKAAGYLLPGAGLLINEGNDDDTPAEFKGDGLGDFSHIGLYVGEKALYDTDKNGKNRLCNVVHSSYTMGRVAGSTLANGWTHVILFPEVDYGIEIASGVALGAEIAEDSAGDDDDAVDVLGAEETPTLYATVWSPDGGPVNMRAKPTLKCGLYKKVACGEIVAVLERDAGTQGGEQWSLIRRGTRDWYMMTRFLRDLVEAKG